MLVILIVSIAIRLAALVGLLFLFRRRMTRGVLALTVVVGLLVLRQLLTLATDGGGTHIDELPDLAVSCVLAGVVALIARHGRPRLLHGLDQRQREALSEIALNRNVVVVLDADGVIRYLNSAVEQATGYRPEELLGRTPFEFIHEADHEMVRTTFLEGLKAPGPGPAVELRFRAKDGTWRTLSANANNRVFDPELQCVIVSARDVTDHARAAEQARIQWERALQFIDLAEVMFLGLDTAGTITLLNRAGARALGYSEIDDLLGRDWFDTCLPPEAADEIGALFRRAMQGRGALPEHLENPVRRRDGVERLIAWHNVVLRDEQGRPVGTVSAGEDVTERRELETELLKFRLGIERSSDAIFLTDPDGVIVYANPAFETIYGYSPEEVVGHTPRVLKSGRMDATAYEELWRRLKAKEVVRREIVNKTKDGRLLTIESTANAIVGEDGNIVGFLAIQRDITQRKLADELLRQSESEYRDLFEQAVFGIYRSTPDGRFLAVNPALVAMLGYESEEELLRVDIRRDVYAEPAQREHILARHGTQERAEGVEVEWRRKDGGRLTVRLSGRLVRDEVGQIRFYEMVAEDVTERRALEQQLRHAQKLEAVGQLTAGIAHDFNNILTAIIANAEMVSESLPADHAELRTDVDEIRAAARRATQMIRKLMTFSRREHLDVELLDLTTVVEETTAMLRRVLPETIRVVVGEAVPGMTVQANRGALDQILLNIATNARDAMPGGGRLVLEIHEADVDERFQATHGWGRPGPYVCLSVSDTGTGMDERTRQKIFEPFFTTKGFGQGTGLGLAMVYGLMKQHGGYIDVYSEPGRGTAFKLYFPLLRSEEVRAERAAPKIAAGGSETILLVEDESAIRRSAQRILERHGYRVLTASDGEQAFAFLRDHIDDIDLIVADAVMPHRGGLELFEMVRELGDGVGFVLTSGYGRQEALGGRHLDAGPAFLRKPWTVEELVRTIRHTLDARRTDVRTTEG